MECRKFTSKRRYQRRQQSRRFGAFPAFLLLTGTVTSAGANLPASAGNPRAAGIWGLFSAYRRRSLTSKHFLPYEIQDFCVKKLGKIRGLSTMGWRKAFSYIAYCRQPPICPPVGS